MEFRILPAVREDAAFIAQAILGALGDELVYQMAGSKERLPLVEEVFINLARMEKSQYSYKNTLIAFNEREEPIGAVVSYDGADLYELREAFIKEANRVLGWRLKQSDFSDETTSDEIYLDSLMVVPACRRNGLGTKLIKEVGRKAQTYGKPLGLLVDPENANAIRLYSSLGFVNKDMREFAGKEMNHMQIYF